MRKKVLAVLLSISVFVGSLTCTAKAQAEEGNKTEKLLADTGAGNGTSSDNNLGTGTDAVVDSDIAFDSDTRAENDTGIDNDAESDSGTGIDSDTGSNNAGTDNDAEPDKDVDEDTDSGTDTGNGTDAVKETYVGLEAEYHTQEQIREYYKTHPIRDMEAEFKVKPSVTEPYALGELTEETKQDALNMLNLFRYITGVPEVSITEKAQNYAQAAALVSAINRKLSHVAERPEGMSKEMYDMAVFGTFNSNLAAGGDSLCNNIIRYMLETNGDPGFGHRRQLLEYYFTETGFGLAESVSGGYYSATFVDANIKEDKIISYPGQNQPIEYFGPGYAWTVIVPEVVDDSKIHVKLTDTKTGNVWDYVSGSKNFRIDKDNRSTCLIFSPSPINYRVGDKYRVEITGISNPISYEVNFFQLGDYVPLQGIHSSVKAYAPFEGETHYMCTVQFIPENATNKVVTWTSSDSSVAEPVWAGNGACQVIAKKAGNAVFTATSEDGGHTAKIEINVKAKTTSIELTKHEVTIGVGQSFELYGKAYPEKSKDTIHYKETYDKNIIQKTDTNTLGKIKVTGKAVGQTTITAYAYSNRDVQDFCKVTVVEPVYVTGITLDKTEVEAVPGDSFQLQPMIIPSNATCKEVQWSSSDSNVAKVTDGMVVCGSNALGKAVITAKMMDGSEKTAVCTVKVYGKHDKLDAPQVVSHTSDSVTLRGESGGIWEYSMDKVNWQNSNVFTGLEPDHEYTFYIRVKADEYVRASDPSEGTTVKTDAVSMIDCKHESVTVKNKAEATCTEKGYTGDTYCLTCNKKISTGKEVKALGHNYTKKIAKEPSVSEEGIATYICTRCDDSYTETLPKISGSSGTGKDDSTANEPAKSEFTIKNGVLLSYNGKSKSVAIPKGVKEIGAKAFYQNKTIKNITIPKGVKKIGNYAFAESGLTKVVIPKGVTSIGKYAFNSCGKLKSLAISGSVKTIGSSAFGGCGFKKVVVPEGVKKMGSMAFIACDKLESVTLPGSLKKIPVQAFAHSSNLKKVVIKSGCTTIGDHAFWYCIKLKNLTIPKGVKKIEERAFLDTAIKKITLPKSVTKIDNKYGIFGFCERPQSLQEITILNPTLKLDNMLGISMPANTAIRYGLPLQKSITIKGYKKSTAEKFVSYINKHKSKYKKSAKFKAL